MKADGTFLCYWMITEKMFIVFFFFYKNVSLRSGHEKRNSDTNFQCRWPGGWPNTSDILLLDYCPKMSKTT